MEAHRWQEPAQRAWAPPASRAIEAEAIIGDYWGLQSLQSLFTGEENKEVSIPRSEAWPPGARRAALPQSSQGKALPLGSSPITSPRDAAALVLWGLGEEDKAVAVAFIEWHGRAHGAEPEPALVLGAVDSDRKARNARDQKFKQFQASRPLTSVAVPEAAGGTSASGSASSVEAVQRAVREAEGRGAARLEALRARDRQELAHAVAEARRQALGEARTEVRFKQALHERASSDAVAALYAAEQFGGERMSLSSSLTRGRSRGRSASAARSDDGGDGRGSGGGGGGGWESSAQVDAAAAVRGDLNLDDDGAGFLTDEESAYLALQFNKAAELEGHVRTHVLSRGAFKRLALRLCAEYAQVGGAFTAVVPPTDKQLEAAFKVADSSGDNRIQLPEFLAFWDQVKRGQLQEALGVGRRRRKSVAFARARGNSGDLRKRAW
jgi:hypothetical protein